MNSVKLVSIVIPCFNDVHYVEQSINSALNQTYPYKEVIVVDDGSNEKTKAVLKKIEPEITRLITQENFGQSKARNVGIEAAKGDYIMVLDSDDFFEPTFCEEAIKLFDDDNLIKIVTCQATLLFPNNEKQLYIPKGGDLKSFLYANNALGTAMFKKSDWDKVNGYDENMRNGFEDWEFFIRLLSLGGEAHVIQKPLYWYRKRKGSTTEKANKRKYELLTYIYMKHKVLFVSEYDSFIPFLLQKMERAEKNELKVQQKIDYRLGEIILRPIRFIKNIFE